LEISSNPRKIASARINKSETISASIIPPPCVL
jgi:hypothetical protein